MERWDTVEELAEAARAVAAEKRTSLADVAAAFHERGKEAGAPPTLYGDDKTHLGRAGTPAGVSDGSEGDRRRARGEVMARLRTARRFS